MGDEAVSVASGIGTITSFGGSAAQAVFVGVTSGVLVWTITRVLDRVFKISR